MSRKDYCAIAAVIHNQMTSAYVQANPLTQEVLGDVARDLASVMRADNARFDESRFLTACGL